MKFQRFCIHTYENNDGYQAKNEYFFENEEEVVKFVNRKESTDIFGEKQRLNYYEFVENVQAEIDIDSLHEKDMEDVKEVEL